MGFDHYVLMCQLGVSCGGILHGGNEPEPWNPSSEVLDGMIAGCWLRWLFCRSSRCNQPPKDESKIIGLMVEETSCLTPGHRNIGGNPGFLGHISGFNWWSSRCFFQISGQIRAKLERPKLRSGKVTPNAVSEKFSGNPIPIHGPEST